MADEIRAYSVTVPAGTAIASAIATALPTPIDRLVERVQVRVPGGTGGQVGFAFQHAHQQVIPYGFGQWIVTDNEAIDWPLGGPLMDGDWALLAYNTGSFPHTLQIRFLMTLAVIPALPRLPLSVSELSGVVS